MTSGLTVRRQARLSNPRKSVNPLEVEKSESACWWILKKIKVENMKSYTRNIRVMNLITYYLKCMSIARESASGGPIEPYLIAFLFCGIHMYMSVDSHPLINHV